MFSTDWTAGGQFAAALSISDRRADNTAPDLQQLGTMELLIYAAFLVLAVLAYVSRQVASKGEERKVNVSNINFKRWEKLSTFSS